MFSDDTLIKTNNVSEIYENITTYETTAHKYKININWNKVIIVKNKDSALRNFRDILHRKYRNIKFGKYWTYLGRK